MGLYKLSFASFEKRSIAKLQMLFHVTQCCSQFSGRIMQIFCWKPEVKQVKAFIICDFYFQISTVSVSLDHYRASVDHGISFVFSESYDQHLSDIDVQSAFFRSILASKASEDLQIIFFETR